MSKNEGRLKQIKKVLWCRASQIDNPGERDCIGCLYRDQVGGCDDLRIMSDALDVINDLDIFKETFIDALDKGYTIKLCKEGSEVDGDVSEDESPQIPSR